MQNKNYSQHTGCILYSSSQFQKKADPNVGSNFLSFCAPGSHGALGGIQPESLGSKRMAIGLGTREALTPEPPRHRGLGSAARQLNGPHSCSAGLTFLFCEMGTSPTSLDRSALAMVFPEVMSFLGHDFAEHNISWHLMSTYVQINITLLYNSLHDYQKPQKN